MPSRFFCAALAITAVVAWAPAHAGPRVAPTTAYLNAISDRLPGVAQTALTRIADEPRRLLAARAYLRAGESLPQRWSWSEAQLQAFAGTPAHQAFLAEVAKVQAQFAQQSPGFTLGAGTDVRTIEVQLARWNTNPGVARVATRLHEDAAFELRRGKYPAAPAAEAAERFAQFLVRWRPPFAAPLAAPGLSLHGQLRAVDFHVERDGRLVASTEVASVKRVWEQQGWARKLKEAASGSRFVGPLASPNEPWHYEYTPHFTE